MRVLCALALCALTASASPVRRTTPDFSLEGETPPLDEWPTDVPDTWPFPWDPSTFAPDTGDDYNATTRYPSSPSHNATNVSSTELPFTPDWDPWPVDESTDGPSSTQTPSWMPDPGFPVWPNVTVGPPVWPPVDPGFPVWPPVSPNVTVGPPVWPPVDPGFPVWPPVWPPHNVTGMPWPMPNVTVGPWPMPNVTVDSWPTWLPIDPVWPPHNVTSMPWPTPNATEGPSSPETPTIGPWPTWSPVWPTDFPVWPTAFPPNATDGPWTQRPSNHSSTKRPSSPIFHPPSTKRPSPPSPDFHPPSTKRPSPPSPDFHPPTTTGPWATWGPRRQKRSASVYRTVMVRVDPNNPRRM